MPCLLTMAGLFGSILFAVAKKPPPQQIKDALAAAAKKQIKEAPAAAAEKQVGASLSDSDSSDGSTTTMGCLDKKPKARKIEPKCPPAVIDVPFQGGRGTIGNEKSSSDSDSSENVTTPAAAAKPKTLLTSPSLSGGKQKDSESPEAIMENAWVEKSD